MMTNSELQDAITNAKAMLDATGHAAPDYEPLRDHLKRLLAIQAARAGFIQQVAPQYVQPPIAAPQWVPAAPWQPPFGVTCADGSL